MQDRNDMARWPRPQAGDWFDPDDPEVGTADFGSNYLWDVRVRLQVRVRDGAITEARCHVEDQDSMGIEDVIAASIANHLVGKPIMSAADCSRPDPPPLRTNWSREEAVRAGEFDGRSHPGDLMWSVSFAEDATRFALADWASKSPDRPALLPLPKEAPKTPFVRRVLRRIPFLRGFGI
ncbi:MAG TPA: hypothetical protein VL500_05355 [Candidatus Eisenbacteria bacterium]|nr:hypothetical protein [Candidatus Eisenbacteria bacterium]